LICCASLIGCAPAIPADGMDIYTFSIGKADCSLLSFDGKNVLIDAGEKDDGNDIVKALKELRVSQIDLVILTHFDKDHIGGFPAVCEAFPVSGVLRPDYVRDSDAYAAMEAAIEKHAIPVQAIQADSSLTLGSASFTLWPSTQAYDSEEGNDNEMTLVASIAYGQTKLLFMGDANERWLSDLCYGGYALDCDILKFPYHGKWQKNVPVLLALSLPKYAIITDSEKNPAALKTLDALKGLDIPALRTIDGDIHLFTDGKKVTVR